jgi:hypothetical protein
VSVKPVQQAAGCELLRSKINRGQEEHHCASSGWGDKTETEKSDLRSASLCHNPGSVNKYTRSSG